MLQSLCNFSKSKNVLKNNSFLTTHNNQKINWNIKVSLSQQVVKKYSGINLARISDLRPNKKTKTKNTKHTDTYN